MSSLNIKFDSRKIQRNLENKINRIVQKENKKKIIKKMFQKEVILYGYSCSSFN